jgi:hypothetical protein
MNEECDDIKKIDGEKMRDLADKLKEQIPGLGFALIVFDFANDAKVGNYISNVREDFMIKALEQQLESLKNGTTFSTPEV